MVYGLISEANASSKIIKEELRGMIRMAFMTDNARVIGASTSEGNAARFKLLPEKLPEVMGKLYTAENIVVGAASFAAFIVLLSEVKLM